MSEKYSSAYEMRKRLISILRNDGELNQMLFSLVPSHGEFDDRIYASGVDMRQFDDKTRTQLPRVLVTCREEVDSFEQADLETNSSPVLVETHVLGPADQEELTESIDGRVKFLVLSTRLSNARIISAELVPVGDRVHAREGNFEDAHRITRRFRSANVGVLV